MDRSFEEATVQPTPCISLCVIYGSFRATAAELSGCSIELLAHKSQSVYHLALPL